MRRLLLTLVLTLPAILLVAGPARAVPVSQPTVTGQAVYGSTLTADPGQWSPAVATFAYQWLRDGVPIGGAVASAYTAGLDDLGKTLAVRVTAGDGSGVATSPSTAPVANATMTAKRQRVLGEARYTHDLKARPGRFSAPDAVVTYTWPGGSTARSTRSGLRTSVRASCSGSGRRRRATSRSPSRSRAPRSGTGSTSAGRSATTSRPAARSPPASRSSARRPSRPSTTRAAGAAPGSSSSPVTRGGAFTLVLSEASRVPGFSSGCSSMWSCRVGRFVIINQERWKNASPAWNAAHLALRDYRHMVVNHETGHWLGLGHACVPGHGPAGAGDDAAVEGAERVPVQPVPDDARAQQPDTPPNGPWQTASSVVTFRSWPNRPEPPPVTGEPSCARSSSSAGAPTDRSPPRSATRSASSSARSS